MTKLQEEQKADLIEKEKERRRIARLRQVRQQNVVSARFIRKVVSEKKALALEDIRATLFEQVDCLIEMNGQQGEDEVKKELIGRNSSTPHSKATSSLRRREVTRTDLELAKHRNRDAMRRLRDSKQKQAQEQRQRLENRKKAQKQATQFMKESHLM